MVSKKELEYVNQYARLVPFPGVNYAYDAMETLIGAYKTYEKNYNSFNCCNYAYYFSIYGLCTR